MKLSRIGLSVTALASAGLLILSGCSSSSDPKSTDGSASSSSFVSVNGSEPQNPLIPTNTNEEGGSKLIEALFSGLVKYNAKGEPENDVADSFEPNADFTEWTIKIKTDRKFTDGTPVTSKSFVDAWKYGANAANAQLGQSFFSEIEGYNESEPAELTGLTVVDDSTFTVKLTGPDSEFPVKLGYYVFFPLPEVAFKDMKAFGENPVGNGAYKFQDENSWQHDVDVTFVPNPDYVGDFKAQNDGLIIKFYANLDTAYADLTAGNLDVLDTVPPSAFEVYENDLGDRSFNKPVARNQTFTIPERLEHFSGEEGKLRRQALSLAINREEITKVIFAGTRTPANDFTSPALPGFDKNIPGSDVLKFDAKKAKELWAQADAISPWTGTFKIAYNADGGHSTWVDAVTQGLKNNLGIDAEGEPYPTFKEARDKITNRTITTAFRTGWVADYPLLSNFLSGLYVTGAGSNDGDYSNPEFDALITKSRQETDEKASFADLNQAQEILFKDMPVIPLWYQNMVGGWSEKVDNVNIEWDGTPVYSEITKK